MEYQYTPNIVSMDGLHEAIAASVSLSMEEQASLSSYSEPTGPTMGMYPTEPVEP